MKNLIALVFAVFTFSTCTIAQNSNNVYVNGYTKSNGTHVQGHYRTAPNSTINDNYTTSPNVNPYTGTRGTIAPSSSNTYTTPRYTPSNPYSPSYSNTYTSPSYFNKPSYPTYGNW